MYDPQSLELAKEVGKAAATEGAKGFWQTVQSFGAGWNEYLRALLLPVCDATGQALAAEMNARFQAIPHADRTEPRPLQAAPLVRGLIDAQEHPELQRLYIELLGKSADIKTAGSVHPRYSQVLSSISPDEARLLEGLRPLHETVPTSILRIPVKCTVKVEMKDGSSETFRQETLFAASGKHIPLEFGEQIKFYLENLTQLGVIQDPGRLPSHVAPETVQKQFGHPGEYTGGKILLSRVGATYQRSGAPRIEYASSPLHYRAESFGRAFLKAVLPTTPPTEESGYGLHMYAAEPE